MLSPRTFENCQAIGSCDCGRQILVFLSHVRENQLVCECGLGWYWKDNELRRDGKSKSEKHLAYIALAKEHQMYARELREVVDVIRHHGGRHFPILTFDSAAEAINALVKWVKDGKHGLER